VVQAAIPVRVSPALVVYPIPIPAATAMMTRVARVPSISMDPYPTKSASFSLRTCLAEVPDETKAWKPEMAPQLTGQRF
jgi:hypothetical protein